MKVGFFVWNPFQIYQFESVAQHFPNAAYVLQRRKNVDFDRLFPKEFLDSLSAPIHFVTRAELAQLDGKYDAMVCQTAFGHMERLNKTKLVSLQYSMSKERHQYGPWRILCDLNLVYGQYSYDRISPYSPCEMVGNPRFDRWFAKEFDPEKIRRVQARLDPAKKTILYMPTWGELSSMTIFGEAIAELSETYNVIAKVHHKTDSHELSRKVSLTEQGVQDIFGASDDMLHLLHEADLVLSDFSGAIFDAINVGKPVILLQQDPERLASIGAEKFGLESIEYARRDEIGPVVSTPEKLAQTVEKVLAGTISFRESNQKLKQNCFAAEQNCGALAAEAIRRLVEQGNTRPYYQIYVRDMLREQRVADEERTKSPLKITGDAIAASLKSAAKATNQATEQKGKTPSTPRHSLKKSIIKSALRLYELAWSPIFAVAANHIVRAARKHVENGTKFAASPVTSQMASLLPSKRQLQLARRYDKPESAQVALWLSRLAYKKSKSVGLTSHINFLAKYNRREEMGTLIDELLSYSLHFRARFLQRATRAQDFLGERYEQISLAREEIRNYLIRKVSKSKNKKENFRHLNILVLNRWLDDAHELARTALLTPHSQSRIYAGVDRAKALMEEFYCLTEAANHNYLPRLPSTDLLCLYQGKIQRVGDIGTSNVVEFFLPFYFYIETETDPATRQRICAMLRTTLRSLTKQGAAIVPRHQFRLNDASPRGTFPVTFSYHTTGDKPGWWHIKDSPLAGYFSIDTRGYSGWSSLGSLSQLPAEAATLSKDKIDEIWTSLQERFVDGRISKYPQHTSKFVAPHGRYIFFPMQLVNDTVAQLAWIPTLELAHLLVKLAPEHGYHLVIKVHPKCTDPDVARFVRKYSGHQNIYFSNASIHDILPKANAVVTVNSGVGLEALLHGKAVITTGKSEYGVVTHQAKNAEELTDAIRTLGDKNNGEQIKRFIAYYVLNCLLAGDDQKQMTQVIGTILSRVHTSEDKCA